MTTEVEMPLTAGNIKLDKQTGTLASPAVPGKPGPTRNAVGTGGERSEESLAEFLAKIKPWQDAIGAHPATGSVADKAFFDDLYGE